MDHRAYATIREAMDTLLEENTIASRCSIVSFWTQLARKTLTPDFLDEVIHCCDQSYVYLKFLGLISAFLNRTVGVYEGQEMESRQCPYRCP